ncbi:MAG: RelA/SpoT family protein [Acidimicrobiales bacterium]
MATVTRVLPWRRHAMPSEEVVPLLDAFRANHPQRNKAPVTRIVQAFEVAAEAHAPQRRGSGESYINHPLAVATICARLGMDEPTIVGALLHDVVEDTDVSLADIERLFGAEVATLVDGVTKLDRIHFESKEEQQAATMRKMLVAMAKDIRVLAVKLADRLHNMRTLAAMVRDKQRRIAQETLDIYAPLANRLGMQELKTELEDLAFASLHPKRYAEIDHMVAERQPERESYLARVLAEVQARLGDLRIDAAVSGRGKHLYSIYEKMQVKAKEFDDIYDLLGIRVIVDGVKDCYAALGCIHGTWMPVPGRFKDYIAMPKFNLYQSLHTTVIGPGGKVIEVQIRTREMHVRAERGVAAHWIYKLGPSAGVSNGNPSGSSNGSSNGGDIDWLNRIIDLEREASDPALFMENLKSDLEPGEIFVFTPKGRVVTLPRPATTIDFAYAVHTEVGHACIGARVNGSLVPLDHKLASGDTCEIITSKVAGAGPSRDWLQTVESPRARTKIRQWFSRERREDALDAGREELQRELRREGLPIQPLLRSPELEAVATEVGYVDIDALLVAVGEHHVSGRSIVQRLQRRLRSDEEPEDEEVLPTRRPRRRSPGGTVGVHVEGFEEVLVRLARCCTPVPGDEIMGFVTRGRGVSVHRADCANAVSLASAQAARLIDVEWDGDRGQSVFVASIEVKAYDRTKLLRDVSNALSDLRVNVIGCSTHTGADRIARMRFEFEMADPGHLDTVIRVVKQIDAVYDAYRIVPGGGTQGGVGPAGS